MSEEVVDKQKKYSIELYTPQHQLYKTFETFRDVSAGIWGELETFKNCTLEVTNHAQNKKYNPLLISEILDLAQPQNDLDTLLLTTKYIGEDTPENKELPINMIYRLVGYFQQKLIIKAKKEVANNIQTDIYHRTMMMNTFNSDIELDDGRNKSYVQPLSISDLDTINFDFTKDELPPNLQERLANIYMDKKDNVLESINTWYKKIPALNKYIGSWYHKK